MVGKMLGEAINVHKNGLISDARCLYEAIITTGDAGAQCYRLYAICLNDLGEKEAAVGAYKKAHALEIKENLTAGTPPPVRPPPPDEHCGLYFTDSSISSELADLLIANGDIAEARSLAEKAIQENPNDALAHFQLFQILAQDNLLNEAMEIYLSASESIKSSFFVCNCLSGILDHFGFKEDAVRVRNNAFGIPESSLSSIQGHCQMPVSIKNLLDFPGASPHPLATVLADQAGGKLSPTYVAVKDITLFSGEWQILHNQSRTLFPDANHGTPTGYASYFLPIGENSGAAQQILIPEPVRKPFKKAILAGGDQNYFHWLIDFLPRLMAIKDTPGFQGLPILIHEDMLPYQTESLAFLGIPEEHLEPLAYPACYPCEELIVPLFPPESPAKAGLRSRHAVVSWLRSLAPGYRGEGRRIYISRHDSKRRKIVNEDALISELKKKGFEVLSLTGLSLESQIEIFSQADCVVGYGAGLTNMVFAPDHCHVIEILPQDGRLNYFEELARVRGLNYDAAMCHPHLSEGTIPIFHDAYIPESSIKDMLATID